MSKANDYLTRTNKGTSFSGSDVDIFGMTVLAQGMRLYVKTGMKPAKGWTVTNMLNMAKQHLGKTFKRTQLLEAADELLAKANAAKALPKTEG